MIYPVEYVPMIENGFEVSFFVDLETTGLEPMRNEILTASLSVTDYDSQVEIDSIELKFRPTRIAWWNVESAAIHGVTLDEAMTFPSTKESTDRMYDFLLKHSRSRTQPMVCHALKFAGFFDTAFLEGHFLEHDLMYEYRVICGIHQSTITYAKAYNTAMKAGFDDFKLDTLCRHFKIPLDHHNASSDRKACQQLYKIFKEAECKMNLEASTLKKPRAKKSSSSESAVMSLLS